MLEEEMSDQNQFYLIDSSYYNPPLFSESVSALNPCALGSV